MTVTKNQRNWYNQLAVLVVPIQMGPDGSKPFVNAKGSITAIYSRRLESLAAKLVKQLNYILDNERDSTGSGAAHPSTTIASVPTHLQRILTTLLVVQVIEIEWLVNGLQRCEQLRFQERMMRSLPCVRVK